MLYLASMENNHLLADENRIFREAALRITGKLEIDKALVDTYAYLRGIIPLDELALFRLDMEPNRMRILTVVRVNADGLMGEPDDELLTMPDDKEVWVRDKMMHLQNWPAVCLGLPPEIDMVEASTLLVLGGIPVSASLVLVLNKELLAGLVAISYQSDSYHAEHLRLFEVLKEPIFIALSNALRFLEVRRLKDRAIEDQRALQHDIQRSEVVVGAERGLKTVMTLAYQVARTAAPVLLLGETGTGKEVVAQAIHRASSCRAGPMIGVNCGALPESLVDSELFGHERGAFTGAIATKRGRFERADGGTLFLDEVADLPHSAQIKLLRVLQTKEFERVGGSQTLRAKVRLIAATHRDLAEMVRRGEFREDLWFRLNVFPILIPPLRERREDIPLLAYHFLESKAREMNLGARPALSPEELERLTAYAWPGNVRELQNAIERALILCRNEPLRFPHLSTPTVLGLPPAVVAPPHSVQATDRLPTLEQVVADYLRRALMAAGGRVAGPGGAAELAGLNKSTFHSKMKRLGVRRSS